jgi:hypothetical protein
VHEDDGFDEVVLVAVRVVATDGMAKRLTNSTSQANFEHLNHCLVNEKFMPSMLIWCIFYSATKVPINHSSFLL